jgi:hypothetical protein
MMCGCYAIVVECKLIGFIGFNCLRLVSQSVWLIELWKWIYDGSLKDCALRMRVFNLT